MAPWYTPNDLQGGRSLGGGAGGVAYDIESGTGSQLEKVPATLTDLPSTHSRVTGTCITSP